MTDQVFFTNVSTTPVNDPPPSTPAEYQKWVQAQQELAVKQMEANLEKAKQSRHSKYPELELLPIRLKRRVNMPTFRLEFDNIHDIHRRILHTLIYIGGGLYFVSAIHEEDKDFMLYVTDYLDKTCRIPYSRPEVNLRVPEPRYVTDSKGVGYYLRPPVREQNQGLSDRTTFFKPFGVPSRAPIAPSSLLRGFNRNENIEWAETYPPLMESGIIGSMRLSNNLAVGLHKEHIVAEYKGRPLGPVRENAILVDEMDFDRPWIRRDLLQVGCRPFKRKG